MKLFPNVKWKQELYFSALLDGHPKFGNDFEKIKMILNRHKISYQLLEGTKDIWCRDYMPVQLRDGSFKQFDYKPSYLKGYEDLRTSLFDVPFDWGENNLIGTNLKLDGGNVVMGDFKAIVSDRVFEENVKYNRDQINHLLHNELDSDIVFIPAYPVKDDMTGHSDGYVRFVNDDFVLVTQLDNEEPIFAKKMLEALNQYNLQYEEMPSFLYTDKKSPRSAIGCYVNYLELDDLIIFPIFGIHSKDEKAIKKIKTYFPNKTIEPVIINDIANEGGLMNCISWEIKTILNNLPMKYYRLKDWDNLVTFQSVVQPEKVEQHHLEREIKRLIGQAISDGENPFNQTMDLVPAFHLHPRTEEECLDLIMDSDAMHNLRNQLSNEKPVELTAEEASDYYNETTLYSYLISLVNLLEQ